MVELADDAPQVAHPVTVRVGVGPGVDLVEDPAVPPAVGVVHVRHLPSLPVCPVAMAGRCDPAVTGAYRAPRGGAARRWSEARDGDRAQMLLEPDGKGRPDGRERDLLSQPPFHGEDLGAR